MSERYESVLLFSGGIDSFVGWHFLGKPQTVYFPLGTAYTTKEIMIIQELIPETIIDCSLGFLGTHEEKHNAHIPFRNLYFALLAATRYSDRVFICGLQDDNMTDKNQEIFKLWSRMLSEMETREIVIDSPFWNMTKVEIVKWFAENYNANLLVKTVSCYNQSPERYCGCCQACFRKAVALFAIDIFIPFTNRQILNYYRKRIGVGIYHPMREMYMLNYIDHIESTKP